MPFLDDNARDRTPDLTGGTAYPRPALPIIASSTIGAFNRFAAGCAWQSEWRDRTWHIALRIATPESAASADIFIAAAWSGHKGVFSLTRPGVERLLAMRCGPIRWNDIDKALAFTLLQDALDGVLQGAPANMQSIQLESWSDDAGKDAQTCSVCMHIHDGSDAPSVSIVFATDAAGLILLAERIGALQNRGSLQYWRGIPLAVTLELGWVDLSVAQLKSLRPQDIILPDGCWRIPGSNRLCLRLSEKLGIDADITNQHLLCSSSKVTMMEQEPVVHAGEIEESESGFPVAALGDLPIRITFDLGERSMSLDQLAAVAPGYVFDLALPAERAVNMRVNGARIGEATLVEIDGRIGVAVTRIMPLSP